ncbi:MAG: ABC transporter permease [Lachnospiraceae bacterium]|nr:ABC transporter permease [Lachnospiraceae bacterium]
MKMILSEIKIGWKRDFRLVLMLLGLSIVGIFCVGTACHLLFATEYQTEKYGEVYEEIQFYSIRDSLLSKAPGEVNTEENTPKFRKFLNLILESEYFEYLMMYDQPVYVDNYRGKFNNVDLYEYRKDISDATQDIKDNNGVVRKSTCVNAFWIGDNVIDYFGLRLGDGRQFAEDDFVLKNPDDPISVILGANYAEDYKVGDEIFISFVFAERPAKVVGLLEEGSNIYYGSRFRNLDNYLIMPMFMNDTYEGQEIYNFYVNHMYVLRNEGTVATKLSIQDVEEILDSYSKEAGFELQNAYYIEEAAMAEKINFDYGIEVVSFLVSAIAAAALAAAFLFVGVCTANRTKKNRRYFAVLAMNGCGKGQICSILLLDAAVIELLAGLLAGGLFTAVFGTVSLWGTGVLWGLLLGTAFFTALPCAVTMILLFRSDLIYYLKEEAGDADIGQRDEAI